MEPEEKMRISPREFEFDDEKGIIEIVCLNN